MIGKVCLYYVERFNVMVSMEQEILNKLLNLPSFSLKFIYLLQGNRVEGDNVSSI